LRFRHGGRIRRLPPLGLVRALAQRRLRAPVEDDLRSWASRRWGTDVASMLAGAAGVFSFDHDPGRLSAAFVWPRLLRVSALPPAARYPIGGWQSLIARLEDRARARGVRIETGTRASTLPDPPVIVATELPIAARLLGDDDLRWESGRALCLDIGLERRRGDVFVVADLDEGAWIERFTASDPTLAPDGHELLQAQIGIRPGEDLVTATARIEQLLDMTFVDWRSRQTWRRRQVMDGRTGALDMPGTTWCDRPAVDRGEGVFLAGDMTAAPGMLSEVAWASAQEAARGALAHAG
jgi:phytoene dehydrogenase-like protein